MKITDEVIEQINELYLECGVKAQVARIVGCSPATVTKYIIPGYVSKANQAELPSFDESKIVGPAYYTSYQQLMDACKLTEEEWNEMKEIQKGVMV